MAEQQEVSQTSEQDVVDRIAGLLGEDTADDEPEREPDDESPEIEAEADEADADEPDTDDEDTDESDDTESDEGEAQKDDDFYELTYNGEPVRVAKEDVKDLAQMGYHYKANQDRFDQQWQQAEQAIGQLQQVFQRQPELQQVDTQVALFEQALRSYDLGEMQRLAVDDPAAYVARRAEYDALAAQYQRAAAARQQMHAQIGQQVQQAQQQLLQQEYKRAIDKMPAWKSKERFSSDRELMVSWMRENGYTQAEIDGISNAKELLRTYKAARWDALQKSKKATVDKAKATAPKMVKPGSGNQAPESVQRVQKARAQLRKTGRVEDAARLFLQFEK